MSNTSIVQSAKRSGAVTPSDSTELSFKRLYVGGAGAVAIKHGLNEAAVVYPAVPVGTFIDVEGVRVMAAGTTATNIVWMDW
jgi:hypothetical protein